MNRYLAGLPGRPSSKPNMRVALPYRWPFTVLDMVYCPEVSRLIAFLNVRSTDPFSSVDLTYAGKRICFRRLLSNADAGTKRRSRLTWRAIRPAA